MKCHWNIITIIANLIIPNILHKYTQYNKLKMGLFKVTKFWLNTVFMHLLLLITSHRLLITHLHSHIPGEQPMPSYTSKTEINLLGCCLSHVIVRTPMLISRLNFWSQCILYVILYNSWHLKSIFFIVRVLQRYRH